MDYSARSQMNSVNDHMSYTEDINYVIDSKFFKFHKTYMDVELMRRVGSVIGRDNKGYEFIGKCHLVSINLKASLESYGY